VFTVLDVLPGNAAEVMLGASATPESVAALSARLGLDRPALVRYGDWMKGLATGELGTSIAYDAPIAQLIGERLAVTVPLALLAMLLTTAVAFVLGLYAAARHGRSGDGVIMVASQVGIAIPSFWFAILLIWLFAVKLRWFQAAAFPAGAPTTAAAPAWRCARWSCPRWRSPSSRRPSWRASFARRCSTCCARTSFAPRAPRDSRRAACSGATCSGTRWCR
jgi:ABC-type dipeptide/oligopeptide/nickel transport system permease component